MPLRINIIPQCHVALDQLKAQAQTCDGLPRIPKRAPHGGSVAIVGGGESTETKLDELRAFPGQIWAINSTAKWLQERGVPCTFIAIDPGPVHTLTPWGKKALLATSCHPDLRTHFEDVQLFDLVETHTDGIAGGTTCASRALHLAIHQGYYDIHLWGCDSSFQPGRDHVDRHEEWPEQVIVRANGKRFLTILEWVMQAECISQLLRMAPTVFYNHSGGLLAAMVEDPDGWEVEAVSAALKEAMDAVNETSAFTEPYEPCQLST